MEIVQKLTEGINEDRLAKYKKLAALRQNMTVILENVHDPHNIGAVIRSCDAVGIGEIFILQSDISNPKQYIGINSSRGARKWVKPHYFTNRDECFAEVKQKYKKIFGTHLSETSSSLYQLDLTEPIALVFGNEHAGISDETLKFLDGNFIIPQYGMVQSLNISVACAVSLFEASRQRMLKGMYNKDFNEDNAQQNALMESYLHSHLKFS